MYKDLYKMIKDAGGNVYDEINSKIKPFVPLKDSTDNLEIAKNLAEKKYDFMIVSPRWIN